jgi:hypothetical protein
MSEGLEVRAARGLLLRDSQSVCRATFPLIRSAAPVGDPLDDLAGEARALLAKHSAEGIFWDCPGDTEVVMARKTRLNKQR